MISYDPDGSRGIPTFRRRLAPDGLLTRRQLRAKGLRPGGQDVAAQILWRRPKGKIGFANLFREDLAKPVRPMTSGRWQALAAANRARRTCPQCRADAGYVIPAALGCCVPCWSASEQAA